MEARDFFEMVTKEEHCKGSLPDQGARSDRADSAYGLPEDGGDGQVFLRLSGAPRSTDKDRILPIACFTYFPGMLAFTVVIFY